jgi:MSHA biogenesis protein MshG
MSNYKYTGKNKAGEDVDGIIEAADSDSVAAYLFGLDIYPLEIQEEIIKKKKTGKVDLLLFTRQMYILLKSGIPLIKALKTLETSNQDETLKDLYRDIQKSLDNGYEFSTALQKHKEYFPPFYISMVKVGEMTGRLEEVFAKLYEYIDFENEMKKKAKATLRYPIIVLSVMILAFVILSFFVIPAFTKVFDSFHATLPLPTRILIGFSDFMIHYGAILGVLAGLGIYWFLKYIKTVDGRFWWDKTRLTMPIFGEIIFKTLLARFARSFALAVSSGVSLVPTLTVTAQVLDNMFISSHIEQIKESVERGNTLYNSMKSTDIFTSLVLEMVATGEETGELDTMLNEVGQLYEREVEYDLNNINSKIEPILLVFIGCLVGILALGIFLPIWDLGKVVNH